MKYAPSIKHSARWIAFGLLAVTTFSALAGNNGQNAAIGRYVSVGIIPAPAAWQSKHFGDTQLFITLDSVTGEVRQCGDVTGYCVVIPDNSQKKMDVR